MIISGLFLSGAISNDLYAQSLDTSTTEKVHAEHVDNEHNHEHDSKNHGTEEHHEGEHSEEGVEHSDHSEDSSERHDEHDEHEFDDDHADSFDLKTQYFTPISVSVGAVWDYQQGYNLGASLSISQRAPSSAELFSYGPHIGTNTVEVGAIYHLEVEDGDELHVEAHEQNVNEETSYNADITWRKFEGDFGFVVSAFYNHIQDPVQK